MDCLVQNRKALPREVPGNHGRILIISVNPWTKLVRKALVCIASEPMFTLMRRLIIDPGLFRGIKIIYSQF